MSRSNITPTSPCHDLSSSRARSSTRLEDKSWHEEYYRRELPLIRPKRPPSPSRGEGETIKRNYTLYVTGEAGRKLQASVSVNTA